MKIRVCTGFKFMDKFTLTQKTSESRSGADHEGRLGRNGSPKQAFVQDEAAIYLNRALGLGSFRICGPSLSFMHREKICTQHLAVGMAHRN